MFWKKAKQDRIRRWNELMCSIKGSKNFKELLEVAKEGDTEKVDDLINSILEDDVDGKLLLDFFFLEAPPDGIEDREFMDVLDKIIGERLFGRFQKKNMGC